MVGTARVYTGSTKPTPEQGHVHFFPAETGVRMGVPVEEDIAVVLPFYNEEGVELRHSLQSLVEQERVMNERILARSHRGVSPRPRRLLVCIIMDGWGKASASMKAYLDRRGPSPDLRPTPPRELPRPLSPGTRSTSGICSCHPRNPCFLRRRRPNLIKPCDHHWSHRVLLPRG